MELKIWTKTILSAFKYLEKVTKAIDSVVYKKAIGSVYVSSKNLMEQSCESISQGILELMERKVKLINLNTICRSMLKGISKKSAKILILKHVDNMQSNEISKLLEVSDRTYFRRLNTAYEECEQWLESKGFSAKYFETKLTEEGWIFEIYYNNEEMECKKSKNMICINEDFLRGVIKKLGKTSYSSYS